MVISFQDSGDETDGKESGDVEGPTPVKTLAELSAKMTEFVGRSELNKVPDLGMMQICEMPLVRTAVANDPLFFALKAPDVVGASHMMPEEWLPGAKTVISFFLPWTESVREANRIPELPAIEWLYARVEGQQLIDALARYLVELLTNLGYEAVIPALDARIKTDTKIWRSNWSERHVAFIAGLGTFGLNKALITEKGCAGRYGSVITNCVIDPTPRPYYDVYEYCNHCGGCIHRCPSKAIKKEGKDVFVCAGHVNNSKLRYAPRYGCGKCQTAVVCEHSIPLKATQRR